MCGRFTNKLTWAEIVALYGLTMDRPPHNMRADYKVCPTDPVDSSTTASATSCKCGGAWSRIGGRSL